MKIITKSGANFVIDLVWQKDDTDNKINVNKIKKVFDFILYAKTELIETSYCFLPNSYEISGLIAKKVPLYSLTVFVIESLKEIFSGVLEDSFICFKIDQDKYGVIFIYRGSVLAHEGEFVGNTAEVTEFILQNASLYNVLAAHVLSDVNFLCDKNFLAKYGIELIKHNGPNGEENPSELYLWQQNARLTDALKKSHLRSFDLFTQAHKVLIKKASLVLGAILLLGGLTSGVKSCFFNSQSTAPPVKSRVTPHKPVPLYNRHGVPVHMMLDECFTPLSNLPQYLEIQEINCELDKLSVSFIVNGSTHEKAILDVKNLFAKHASIATKDVSGIFTIQLELPLKLNKTPVTKLKNDKLMTRLHLEKLAQAHDTRIDFTQAEIVESIPDLVNPHRSESSKNNASAVPQTISSKKVVMHVVVLTSPYSPFYLNKNHVLDDINIYNISMSLNPHKVMTWVIKGEYSSD